MNYKYRNKTYKDKKQNNDGIFRWEILLLLAIYFVIVIMDYFNNKLIPNFFFLNQFEKADVANYWIGVTAIIVLITTIIGLLITYKKYSLKKSQTDRANLKEQIENEQK